MWTVTWNFLYFLYTEILLFFYWQNPILPILSFVKDERKNKIFVWLHFSSIGRTVCDLSLQCYWRYFCWAGYRFCCSGKTVTHEHRNGKSRIIEQILCWHFTHFRTQPSCTASVTALCYNLMLARLVGDIGVSTFSVLSFIYSLANAILSGVAQGIQPLWGHCYGKQDALLNPTANTSDTISATKGATQIESLPKSKGIQKIASAFTIIPLLIAMAFAAPVLLVEKKNAV